VKCFLLERIKGKTTPTKKTKSERLISLPYRELAFRGALAASVPEVQAPDRLRGVVDLEVDVTARLPQEKPFERRMLRGRERRARTRARLEQLDGF